MDLFGFLDQYFVSINQKIKLAKEEKRFPKLES